MRWLQAVASLALVLLSAACSAQAPVAAGGDAVIYVIRRAWHTDIGLPVDELSLPLATLAQPVAGVRYISFGFGERQFLLNRESDVGSMLRALLPSQSALLVTFLKAPPEHAFGFENVIQLHVTRHDLDSVEVAIWHELEKTAASQPIELADGPYPGSTFYAARSTYHAFFTCNTWTAETLRAGGLTMPIGVLFAGQIMASAQRIAANQPLPLKPRVSTSVAEKP